MQTNNRRSTLAGNPGKLRVYSNLFVLQDAVLYLVDRYDPEKGFEVKAEILDTWARIIERYRKHADGDTEADKCINRAGLEFMNGAAGIRGHIDGVAVRIMAEMQKALSLTVSRWAFYTFPDEAAEQKALIPELTNLYLLGNKLAEKEYTEPLPSAAL